MDQSNNREPNFEEEMIEIDLREYLYLLWKKKWIIIVLVILALGASYFLSKQMTKIYSTSTLIMINKDSNSGNILEEQMSLNLSGQDNTESYTYILRSRRILNKVINNLNLKNSEGELISPKSLEDKMTVSRRGDTDLIEISINYSDPQKAKTIANDIVSEFKNELKDINRTNLRSASSFVNEQLANVKNNLEKIEQEILQYKTENEIIQPEEQSKNQLKQLSELETGKIESQLKLEQARASLKEVNNYLENENEEIISSKTISNNPVIMNARKDLSALKVELAGLKEKYTEKHPNVKEVKTKIAKIESMMQEEVEEVVSSKVQTSNPLYKDLLNQKINLELQILSSKIQIDTYENRINNLNESLNEIPEKNLELSRLQREAKVTENIYLMLKERQEEINIQTAMKTSDIVVVDTATVNENPIKPNLKLNMAIAFVLAVFIAVFIIFLIEFMDRTIKLEEDVEKATGLSVIGTIPDIDEVDHKSGYGIEDDEK